MLGWRCSRSSYGTLCKVLYDPANPQHHGQRTAVDSLDGKTYVTGCVNWFVKQGEPVLTDYPIVKQFVRKCPPATKTNTNPHRAFETGVVTCDLDAASLPLVMNSKCRTLCEISSDLSSIPLTLFKLKNRHWWQSGEKYHRIEYVIKVILGPADIAFELWYGGQKISEDNSIKVEWATAQAPAISLPVNKFEDRNGGQWDPIVAGGYGNGEFGKIENGRFERVVELDGGRR